MDVLNEYGNLLNGDPLRIKPEDLIELISIVDRMGATGIVSESYSGYTDILIIGNTLRDLVRAHNNNIASQSHLRVILNKILEYNKK